MIVLLSRRVFLGARFVLGLTRPISSLVVAMASQVTKCLNYLLFTIHKFS
jgi:hypothetical protein